MHSKIQNFLCSIGEGEGESTPEPPPAQQQHEVCQPVIRFNNILGQS